MNAEGEHAVRRLVQDVVDEIRSAKTVPTHEVATWVKRGPGQRYSRRTEVEPDAERLVADIDLSKFASHTAAATALRDDPAIGPHIGALVGTPLSAWRWELGTIVNRLASALLRPRPEHAIDDDVLFATEWKSLNRFCASTTVECRMLSPVAGLALDALPLDIGPDARLREFAREDVAHFLERGLLRTDRFLHWEEADVPSAVIEVPFALPKCVGEELGANRDAVRIATARFAGARLAVARVATALRLVRSERLWICGAVTLGSGWLGGMSWTALAPSPPPLVPSAYRLSSADAELLLELIPQLAAAEERLDLQHLQNALRRFNMAESRDHHDDRLVDLMIASEGLFLADQGTDRGELGFRLRLRAARFLGSDAATRGTIMQAMQHAYTRRSAIVHGSRIRTDATPTEELADVLAFVVRSAILKSLASGEAGQLRAHEFWTDLVLA